MLNPGEKNGVIARNCALKSAINAPNYAVFKTLYLLDCAIEWSCIFAYLQSGPVSIQVQRWFSLRCIVPKISTINLEQDFAGFKYKTPRNKALYLNVNIFGTMDRKLNHLWTSIDTGPLCKYAKCSSTVLHNQEDTAF